MSEDRFVGREGELNTFGEMLKDPFGNQRVMFIWGPGGVGKTWLVQQMLAMAKQNQQNFLIAPALIDMYSTGSQHIEGIMGTIVEHLKSLISDNVFTSFDETNKELQDARRLKGYSAEGIEIKLEALQIAFRSCLSQLIARSPIILALDTFEHVHETPVEEWVMSDTGLQMPGLLCIIAGRTPNLLNPDYPQLGGFTDEEALALYDGYTGQKHQRTPEHEVWARKLNEKAGQNPLLLGLALSWLDHNAIKDMETVTQIDFERNIASWFHSSRGVGSLYPGSGELGEVVGQTLVLMAYLNRRFNRYFLNKLVEENFIIGADAASIWEAIEHNLYESREFFFVKGRPYGEIQLHDKLAEMLRLYVLPDIFDDLTYERLQRFADQVVNWYTDLIEKTENESVKNSYRAEQLTYALRLDILNDLRQLGIEETEAGQRLKRLLSPDFARANTLLRGFQQLRSDILDRLILNQMKPDIVALFPGSEQYDTYALLGDVAKRINNLFQARSYWQAALEVAAKDKKPTQQIQATIGLHNSTWQEDAQKSLKMLKTALTLCQQEANELCPTILYEIGFTYRQMQTLDEAIKWYEKALKMARRHKNKQITPTILNDMGYALLLTGNYKRAEAMIQMAARLRELNRNELIEQKTQSAELYEAILELGMSYNTLGQLFRYTGIMDRATGYYSEALEIFHRPEINNYYWLATGLRGRGDAHRQLAQNLHDQERHKSSHTYDQLAYDDIFTSLELCERFGFVGIIARVYRQMGRLWHDRFLRTTDPEEHQQCLQQSLDYLSKGLQIVQNLYDLLEELEILTEIAFWGDDLARNYKKHDLNVPLPETKRNEIKINYIDPLYEKIEQYREEHLPIYHIDIFANLLKMEEAALTFEANEYEAALAGYLESFTRIAQDPGYGSARCRRHFSHLFENIRRLPDPELGAKWCFAFIERWDTTWMLRGEPQTVAEAHPDLFEQFRLYREMGFMFL